jgi:hypothetical protein
MKADLAKSGKPPTWSPTALRAILLNPIYRGERIWNKTEWIKDHETGTRRRFVRPESEADREDLAIVDAETFEGVAAAMRERGAGYRRTPDGRLAKGLRRGVHHRVRTRYPLSQVCREFVSRGGKYAFGRDQPVDARKPRRDQQSADVVGEHLEQHFGDDGALAP